MPYLTLDQIYTQVTNASISQRKWNETPVELRIEQVRQMVDGVIADKEKLKPIIAAETGKSYWDIDKEF